MAKAVDKICRARPLLGTLVEIAAHGDESDLLERAVESAFAAVERVHRLMSYHSAESDVSRLNQANGGEPIVVHAWTYSVLQTSLGLQFQCQGLFNIAVAPVLERLGLLPQAVEDGTLVAGQWQAGAVELLDGNRARLQAAARRIDLGGIAKGFAVDRAVDALRAHGVFSGFVNAGGDLAGFGPQEHVVAIRDPRDPRRLLGQTTLRNAALASSGVPFDPVVSRRSPHCSIIDPRAGEPVTAISGASVRAASCTIADALRNL